MTLFFLEIFLTLATNGDQIFGHDLTGGANGILNVDPLHLFGHDLVVAARGRLRASPTCTSAVAIFVVVYIALHFVNHSRTGRAWRSLREDPLAAEAMGMPVNLLKLMAFAFGAARRSAHRHALRVAQRERLPAHVLVPAADHRLHDGHPRRAGQHGRASPSARCS